MGEHLDLDHHHPLPFVKPDGEDNEVSTRGQSSFVYKFAVHPAHQQGFKVSVPCGRSGSALMLTADVKEAAGNLNIALKEFRPSSKAIFEQERDILRQIRGLSTKHVIHSYATFSQGETHYIILPWAEGGDLDNFWESGKSKPRTPQLALWCLQQMLGLTEALHALHHLGGDGGNSNCRHGDLKPGNILHYRTDRENTLKIADFGISRIHSNATFQRRTGTTTRATTPSYEAPEAALPALRHQARSRKYDVWSLSCIFLEFVVWVVGGWDDLQAFTAERTIGTSGSESPAHFYQLNAVGKAQIHPAVKKKLEELRKNKRSKDGTALGDLLRLLEGSTLQVEVEDRLETGALCSRLRKIVEEAEGAPNYLFDGE